MAVLPKKPINPKIEQNFHPSVVLRRSKPGAPVMVGMALPVGKPVIEPTKP